MHINGCGVIGVEEAALGVQILQRGKPTAYSLIQFSGFDDTSCSRWTADPVL
jgi:hypothetical protein